MSKLDEIKALEKQGYEIDGSYWVNGVSLTVSLIKKTNGDIGSRETVYIPSTDTQFAQAWIYVMKKGEGVKKS
jgi:hypothetical protein